MIAPERHHVYPQCLLRLHDASQDGQCDEAWIEFTLECARWRVPVTIRRADLEALVEGSTVVLEREKHRLLHASDWQRWGRRGGLAAPLRKYGTDWMALIALKRWGRVSAADLDRARVLR